MKLKYNFKKESFWDLTKYTILYKKLKTYC